MLNLDTSQVGHNTVEVARSKATHPNRIQSLSIPTFAHSIKVGMHKMTTSVVMVTKSPLVVYMKRLIAGTNLVFYGLLFGFCFISFVWLQPPVSLAVHTMP